MKCPSCGTQFAPNGRFCPSCGTPGSPPSTGGSYGGSTPPGPPPPPVYNTHYSAPADEYSTPDHPMWGRAIAAMVLGIVGIITSYIMFLGLVLGVVGLILNISTKNEGFKHGIGIAGLVCSIIAVALGGIFTVVCVGACACAAMW